MVPLYGIFNVHAYENICVAWRKASRFIWGVPNITHDRVITLLYGSAPLSSVKHVIGKVVQICLQGFRAFYFYNKSYN